MSPKLRAFAFLFAASALAGTASAAPKAPCSQAGGNAVQAGVADSLGQDPAKLAAAVQPAPKKDFTEELVSFDPKDKNACDKLKTFLASKNIDVQSTKTAAAIQDTCARASQAKEPVTFAFFIDSSQLKSPKGDDKGDDKSDDSKNKSELTISVGGEYHQGNDNYFLGTASVDYTKHVNDRHIFNVNLNANVRTDQLDQSLARGAGEYMYIASDHWAIFSLGEVNHDGPKKINAGGSATSGVIYSIFPYSDRKKMYIGFSAGPGYRYEVLTNNSEINAAILSLRAKFSKELIANKVSFTTSVFYQPSIYQQNSDGSRNVFDPKDFRILAQAGIRVKCLPKAKGFGFSIKGEDEYFNVTPLAGTKNNDLRTFLTLDWSPGTDNCDDSPSGSGGVVGDTSGGGGNVGGPGNS